MKPLISLIAVVSVAVATFNIAPDIKVTGKKDLSRIESTQSVEVAKDTAIAEKPSTEPLSEAKKIEPEKPVEPVAPPPPPVAPAPPVNTATNRVPVGVHDIGGTGSCAAEIAKYNWGQATALAVAKAESGLRPGVINNNPSTKDYSVGCFQINIYGANARTRPPQEQLINAAVNVAYAHKLYTGNGSSFLGQWGVCRRNVNCY